MSQKKEIKIFNQTVLEAEKLRESQKQVKKEINKIRFETERARGILFATSLGRADLSAFDTRLEVLTKIENTLNENKKIMISKEMQFNLLIAALEGGSNYWYFLPDLSMLPKKGEELKAKEIEDYLKDCLVSRIWEAIQNGETIPVNDAENETDNLGEINLASMKKATELMIKDHAQHYADVAENYDATTGDIWLQLVVMKEVIFG